ncbi:MAG TPA: 2-C-methyl-D-erythritol 2,4-cyclodiphosphate synthase [candidate division WOR-3 bacterium]|uniref:2-C-methyl-D-erythritol 2,4-cyclodiphosphate synthase n=1 Tax=candidate division WOR-3 bacterium TaxID=2052148 RepID=A0A7C0VBQ4_UNCW3|nr:2-C-methyl-D-erythritol 2,4-cyclodiphosphate synthase [candidate division WOR-3 bacterium]
MRIGIGYDIHRLVEGRPFILGGVNIPFEKGLLGHSDGDALVHAIIDSILGALGEGNIGILFPDTDERFKGISSLELLKRVVDRFNFKLVNIDAVVICEEPKLNPYIELMRRNISEITGLPPGRISIKPRRKEGLDETGKGNAIEVMSVCLLEEVV